jgi:hypothetical protein
MAKLETRDIKGVEVMSVGTWHGQGCPKAGCRFTTKMLDGIVAAYAATKGKLDPPVKLGHTEKQKILQEDGLPAAGWVANLRRKGEWLVADLMKVPSKIADLIDAGAYRKRSVELNYDYTVDGEKYPVVLTALALLGADLPAVQNLDDITELYAAAGLQLSDGAQAIYLTLPDGLSYGDLQERVRTALKEKYSVNNELWVMDIYDANAIFCRDGAYYRVSYDINADGVVELGDEVEVQRQTTWADLSAADAPLYEFAAATTELDDLLGQLRHLHGRAEKLIKNKTGAPTLRQLHRAYAEGLRRLAKTNLSQSDQERLARVLAENREAQMALDEKALRETLGLDEDADIVEAVGALKAKAEAKPEGDETEATELRTKVTEQDKRILSLEGQLASGSAERQVDAAIAANKLLPKQRDTALKMALRDPKEFEDFLETQPSNLVDLSERGTAGDVVDASGRRVDLTELEPTASEIDMAKKLGTWSPEHRVSLMKTKAEAKGIELPADFGATKEPAKA